MQKSSFQKNADKKYISTNLCKHVVCWNEVETYQRVKHEIESMFVENWNHAFKKEINRVIIIDAFW